MTLYIEVIGSDYTPHLLGRELVSGSVIHVVNAYGDKSCSVVLCVGSNTFVEFGDENTARTWNIDKLMQFDWIHWAEDCEEARKELLG